MKQYDVSDAELILRIRKGDRPALEEFAKRNQGLVIHIARKYTYSPDVLSDLIAEGNIGLLRALEKYDFKRNVKFGTYAYFWIKRFVVRAIMKEFELFRVPERVQEFRDRYEQIKRNYQVEYGSSPSDEEIGRRLKVPLVVLQKLKGPAGGQRVISPVIYDGEKESDLFQILDFGKGDESDFWEILRNKDILEKIFERLRKREKRANIELWIKALKLHFGLEGSSPMIYMEISRELDVSRQRIHQIIKVCLKKLRVEWRELEHEKGAGIDSGNS